MISLKAQGAIIDQRKQSPVIGCAGGGAPAAIQLRYHSNALTTRPPAPLISIEVFYFGQGHPTQLFAIIGWKPYNARRLIEREGGRTTQAKWSGAWDGVDWPKKRRTRACSRAHDRT